ncbi:MAG TPA: hypothetical protein PLK12_04310 [Prolixibacteraceae bacterium]|nr:hypothetical protein [Prolixibacteraceae bacterium]
MDLQYISDQNGKTISVVIPIREWETIRKKIKEVEKDFDYKEPSREKMRENIRQGLRELKQIEKGKLKARAAKEFLDEL